MNDIDTVVCIHGIWGRGLEMTLIKRRLEKEYGLRVLLFSYPSVRGTLDKNAETLHRPCSNKSGGIIRLSSGVFTINLFKLT